MISEQDVRPIDNEETKTPTITTVIDSPNINEDAPKWL